MSTQKLENICSPDDGNIETVKHMSENLSNRGGFQFNDTMATTSNTDPILPTPATTPINIKEKNQKVAGHRNTDDSLLPKVGYNSVCTDVAGTNALDVMMGKVLKFERRQDGNSSIQKISPKLIPMSLGSTNLQRIRSSADKNSLKGSNIHSSPTSNQAKQSVSHIIKESERSLVNSLQFQNYKDTERRAIKASRVIIPAGTNVDRVRTAVSGGGYRPILGKTSNSFTEASPHLHTNKVIKMNNSILSNSTGQLLSKGNNSSMGFKSSAIRPDGRGVGQADFKLNKGSDKSIEQEVCAEVLAVELARSFGKIDSNFANNHSMIGDTIRQPISSTNVRGISGVSIQSSFPCSRRIDDTLLSQNEFKPSQNHSFISNHSNQTSSHIASLMSTTAQTPRYHYIHRPGQQTAQLLSHPGAAAPNIEANFISTIHENNHNGNLSFSVSPSSSPIGAEGGVYNAAYNAPGGSNRSGGTGGDVNSGGYFIDSKGKSGADGRVENVECLTEVDSVVNKAHSGAKLTGGGENHALSTKFQRAVLEQMASLEANITPNQNVYNFESCDTAGMQPARVVDVSKARCCFNCGTESTPSWRRCLESGNLLCNACGLYQKLHNRRRVYRKMRDGRTRAYNANAASNYVVSPTNRILPDGGGGVGLRPMVASSSAIGNMMLVMPIVGGTASKTPHQPYFYLLNNHPAGTMGGNINSHVYSESLDLSKRPKPVSVPAKASEETCGGREIMTSQNPSGLYEMMMAAAEMADAET